MFCCHVFLGCSEEWQVAGVLAREVSELSEIISGVTVEYFLSICGIYPCLCGGGAYLYRFLRLKLLKSLAGETSRLLMIALKCCRVIALSRGLKRRESILVNLVSKCEFK